MYRRASISSIATSRCSVISSRKLHVETKLRTLNVDIPKVPPDPRGNYIPFVRSGNLVFLSGHLPQQLDKTLVKGRLGEAGFDIADGQNAAKLCAINLIASLSAATNGNLDKIKRITKIVGFVNSVSDFTQQAQVLNGCSDFMAEVFAEKGSHARTAIGTSTLPLGVPVEIELIAELEM